MIEEPITIQGRMLGAAELSLIRRLIDDQPERHRTALSKHLCELWDWRDERGRIKDMACRTMLLKLERRGLITLPPSRCARTGAASKPRVRRQAAPTQLDTAPVSGPLAALAPITLSRARAGSADWRLFDQLLRQHHYLGHRTTVGQHMKYLARAADGRLLGCLLFGSAAWQLAPRDRWIGWSAQQRAARLTRLTNNTRFLILPWVQVPHLASHLLGQACRRLNEDWLEQYGHPVALLETFVDTSRFAGTCYRAAGWQQLGQSTGRTRQDKENRPHEAPKLILVRPLLKDWRRLLLE